MITDRLTARVLGVVVLLLALLIDTSCFIFARPEMRHSLRFALVVMIPSLPMFLIGALLLRKAARMKDEEGGERRG
jgi:hypothetical protein